MLTNPVFISICVMCALCLFRCNVMLAILIGTICAVLSSKIPLGDAINLFINGNPENAPTHANPAKKETAQTKHHQPHNPTPNTNTNKTKKKNK